MVTPFEMFRMEPKGVRLRPTTAAEALNSITEFEKITGRPDDHKLSEPKTIRCKVPRHDITGKERELG